MRRPETSPNRSDSTTDKKVLQRGQLLVVDALVSLRSAATDRTELIRQRTGQKTLQTSRFRLDRDTHKPPYCPITAQSRGPNNALRSTKNPAFAGIFISGRPDSNWGPHRPERCALPGCATPRRMLEYPTPASSAPVRPGDDPGARPPAGAAAPALQSRPARPLAACPPPLRLAILARCPPGSPTSWGSSTVC
jgi:hypothetical protein